MNSARDIWRHLTVSEQDEYATLLYDYWYLTKFPEKRGRVKELENLAKERMETNGQDTE